MNEAEIPTGASLLQDTRYNKGTAFTRHGKRFARYP